MYNKTYIVNLTSVQSFLMAAHDEAAIENEFFLGFTQHEKAYHAEAVLNINQ